MILDHFHGLRPRDLAEMTDWQIDRLYCYPRDSEGKLKEPVLKGQKKKELDVEGHVAAYMAVVDTTNQTRPGTFSEEVIAATIEEIRRHHGAARTSFESPSGGDEQHDGPHEGNGQEHQ
jgi:hypothetical protein